MKYTIESIKNQFVGKQVKIWFKGDDEPLIGVIVVNDPKIYHTMPAPFYLIIKKGGHNNYCFGPSHVRRIEFDHTDYLAEAGEKEMVFEDDPKRIDLTLKDISCIKTALLRRGGPVKPTLDKILAIEDWAMSNSKDGIILELGKAREVRDGE